MACNRAAASRSGRPFPPAPQETVTPSLAPSAPGWKPPDRNDHKTRCAAAAEAVTMRPGVQTFSWDGERQQVYGFILLSCREQECTPLCTENTCTSTCVCVLLLLCGCVKGEERRVTPTVTATAHQLCRGPEGDSRMLE